MKRKKQLVVIGNGMAGARFVEEIVARGGSERFAITVFGDEPHGNYNRILLSSVLAGSHTAEDIVINPLSWYADHDVTLHAGVRVDGVDLASRHVTASSGLQTPYDRLVFATGSRPLVPPMDGLTADTGGFRDGVFVFRTLDDCAGMLAWARRARRAVIIGGGLLGLEAARGLLNSGLDVHVVHLRSHVMETQLDPMGGEILLRQLERLGLHVHLEKSVDGVLGDASVAGVVFRDGSVLECDMVVIAAGVRPNTELAERAGLTVGRAIVVGDNLSCRNAPGVYALGECAEHRGRLYGLVAPLWEQAAVLADRLSGRNPEAVYRGSRASTKLKVAGLSVAVMGEKDAVRKNDEVVSYAEPSRGVYKKLVLREDRLIGAIVIGDGAIVPTLVQSYLESNPVSASREELLLSSLVLPGPSGPAQIPDGAQICDCNAVTKAQIVQAVLEGSRSLPAVCAATRAGTGCGSCRPEVQAIVDLACQGLTAPDLLALAGAAGRARPGPAPHKPEAAQPAPSNKVERLKQEKDGLDIVADVPRLARGGWEAISEADRERLKWAGVFFRRQTPGRFMMRLRIPNGFTSAAQVRAIAEISRDSGAGFADITTRQQIQLRGFRIDDVPAMWDRLTGLGLGSLQTGMDNIRNVVGCPVAGLTSSELFDASPVVRAFTRMFVGNKDFTNLPRKFNVAITACLENCGHVDAQDLALTPAIRVDGGTERRGFNVAVGGKMGSGGPRLASPLDVFVTPDEAPGVCAGIVEIFRDHGTRGARNKARLAFLVDDWGLPRLRDELQRRLARPLAAAGTDARLRRSTDHLGPTAQKQSGLSYVGMLVPVGRITVDQLFEVARLADEYGNGDVRITTAQNLIIPNVPDDRLPALMAEPLLGELEPEPSGLMRGLLSCTGIDYCHFALVETKSLAFETARHLAAKLPDSQPLSMHWSGCPAGCGNHATAAIGLVGKNIRRDGEVVDAVDVFIGGRTGLNAVAGTRVLEDVPCDELPQVLEQIVPMLPYFSKRIARSAPAGPTPAPAEVAHAHV